MLITEATRLSWNSNVSKYGPTREVPKLELDNNPATADKNKK